MCLPEAIGAGPSAEHESSFPSELARVALVAPGRMISPGKLLEMILLCRGMRSGILSWSDGDWDIGTQMRDYSTGEFEGKQA